MPIIETAEKTEIKLLPLRARRKRAAIESS
jgi:hypothetical protein